MFDIDDFLPIKKCEAYGISRELIYKIIKEGKIKKIYFHGCIPGISKKEASSLITPEKKHRRGGFRGGRIASIIGYSAITLYTLTNTLV